MFRIIKCGLLSMVLAACSVVPQGNFEFKSRGELRKYILHHVVKVSSDKGHGTGFVFINKNKSYIMTNNHVCDGVGDKNGVVSIQYNYMGISYKSKVLKNFSKHDLCVIKGTHIYSQNGLRFANKDPQYGDYMGVLGYPKGNPPTMVDGEFSGEQYVEVGYPGTADNCNGEWNAWYGVCIKEYPAYVTTARIFGGNSGSPAFNIKGEVVGVAFAGGNTSTVENYIVPLKYVKEFLKEL